jgi:hypothetical protein
MVAIFCLAAAEQSANEVQRALRVVRKNKLLVHTPLYMCTPDVSNLIKFSSMNHFC